MIYLALRLKMPLEHTFKLYTLADILINIQWDELASFRRHSERVCNENGQLLVRKVLKSFINIEF